MKIRLKEVRIVRPLARIHARQPAAIASVEGIWSSSPSASAVVALLCTEHPTPTSRIALLAAVCRREAFGCFMPHHSAPQVAGWMIHILSALVRIAKGIGRIGLGVRSLYVYASWRSSRQRVPFRRASA